MQLSSEAGQAEGRLLRALAAWAAGEIDDRSFYGALNHALLHVRRETIFDILCGHALPESVYDKVFEQIEFEMIRVKKILNSTRRREVSRECNNKYRVLCARRSALVEANDYVRDNEL